jgi:hypothetical protein
MLKLSEAIDKQQVGTPNTETTMEGAKHAVEVFVSNHGQNREGDIDRKTGFVGFQFSPTPELYTGNYLSFQGSESDVKELFDWATSRFEEKFLVAK